VRSADTNPTSACSLRVVFKQAVMSYRFPPHEITLAEIARTLDKLPVERFGNPVAINVMMDDR
jgi:hypothetical protein